MALAGPAVYGKQSGLGGGGRIEPLNGRRAGVDKLLSPTSLPSPPLPRPPACLRVVSQVQLLGRFVPI